jgi:ubiquinone/menaquinone biosynthesis C-methylase UbiE
MLRESRAILRAKNSLSYLVIDAVDIPFPEGFFDAVIANHMLYHVRNLDQALSEVRRVLKEDGQFYAATNGPKHLQELFTLEWEFFSFDRPDQAFWAASFSLENGSDILSSFFDSITQYTYPNQLHVTDSKAILAYLDSKSDKGLDPEQSAALEDRLVDEIQKSGWITISAEAGVFHCR